jgi:Haem-binding domain
MIKEKGLPMKKRIVGIILLLLVAFAAIQFIPIDRSNPPIEVEISVPSEVKTVLQSACYDCHSNETTWPWYSHIAPISWLVAHDVHAGRDDLNFSTWNRYSTKQQVEKLKETLEEVEEGKMPPWLYLAVHRDVQLSDRERVALQTWARESAASAGPTATSPQNRPEDKD